MHCCRPRDRWARRAAARVALAAVLAGSASCDKKVERVALQPLPEVSGNVAAAPRVGGNVGTPEAPPAPQYSPASPRGVRPSGGAAGGSAYAGEGGDISLNF